MLGLTQEDLLPRRHRFQGLRFLRHRFQEVEEFHLTSCDTGDLRFEFVDFHRFEFFWFFEFVHYDLLKFFLL
jgi:hypothetical protein